MLCIHSCPCSAFIAALSCSAFTAARTPVCRERRRAGCEGGAAATASSRIRRAADLKAEALRQRLDAAPAIRTHGVAPVEDVGLVYVAQDELEPAIEDRAVRSMTCAGVAGRQRYRTGGL